MSLVVQIDVLLRLRLPSHPLLQFHLKVVLLLCSQIFGRRQTCHRVGPHLQRRGRRHLADLSAAVVARRLLQQHARVVFGPSCGKSARYRAIRSHARL